MDESQINSGAVPVHCSLDLAFGSGPHNDATEWRRILAPDPDLSPRILTLPHSGRLSSCPGAGTFLRKFQTR